MVGKKEGINKQAGFTLIEIAIVMVIIGLLLGGVLKGQEMIRNARVHNVIDQGSAIKAAVLGFQDRYRAYPGDYNKATDNIPNMLPTGITTTSTYNGDGNGRVGGDASVSGEKTTRPKELSLFWRHMAKSGFIAGDFDGSTNTSNIEESSWSCVNTTCMANAYNGGLFFGFSDQYYDPDDANAKTTSSNEAAKTTFDARLHVLLTGHLIPVEILSEADTKMDDGNPATGTFRVGDLYSSTTATAGNPNCVATGTGTNPKIDHWNVTGQATDCGGVYLM